MVKPCQLRWGTKPQYWDIRFPLADRHGRDSKVQPRSDACLRRHRKGCVIGFLKHGCNAPLATLMVPAYLQRSYTSNPETGIDAVVHPWVLEEGDVMGKISFRPDDAYWWLITSVFQNA